MNVFVYIVFLSIVTCTFALKGDILTLGAGTNITVRVQTYANGQRYVSPKEAYLARCDNVNGTQGQITCTSNCTITNDECVSFVGYPFYYTEFATVPLFPLTDYSFPSWCSIDLYGYLTYVNNQSMTMGKPAIPEMRAVASCAEDPSTYRLLFLPQSASASSIHGGPPSMSIIVTMIGLIVTLVSGIKSFSSSPR
eukprot:TRINITY_DN7004_c0_g1_i2.p1 TRINITY_DN7004_c0_g1~~TRINITY_DN7004_c0_g1_i2.p1  ORF type:complete len:195 (+),score=23.16 TRINITY_DN7004_c0_g1_i2:35-619(+)